MKDLWERFKGWWCGNDIFDVYLEQMRRQEWDLERHRALAEQAAEIDAKQARAELRDRFAMAALTGVIASPVHERMPYAFDAARCAYEYADAMMKARGDGEEMK